MPWESFSATMNELREKKGMFNSLEKEPGTCVRGGSPRRLRGCSGVELPAANKGRLELALAR